ncbi:MAG: assimilatory sulfite reductase (NADPH) flavoprotein subunit [Alkalicoccus sp.]|nr:MAG: assimilatory sulfite reductase (NADPH) flavoprotein subunit [Alkalicoccus sp.]
MQLQTTNSPFNEKQAELLNQLLDTLNDSQKNWLSGYLAFSQETASASAAATVEAPAPAEAQAEVSGKTEKREITILIGSHTGNCQALGEETAEKLRQKQFSVKAVDMDSFKPKNLKKVEDLLVITSTHGEGDPPDNAIGFHDFLFSRKAPALDGLRFSVLALGDSSYEKFCQTGIEFDQRLEELGGERIHPRYDCDVEFEEPAAAWFEGVLEKLGTEASEAKPEEKTAPAAGSVKYSKKNPFQAEILENINLNGRGSNKETRHLELSLEGSGLTYEPGDSLGIIPENDPELVDQLIVQMGWDPEHPLPVGKEGTILPLRNALVEHVEITTLTKPLLEKLASLTEDKKLKDLLAPDNKEQLTEYIYGRDLLDAVRDFGPWDTPPEKFISVLRKIPVRLYSIASSMKANPEEVHLTVGAVRYDAHGRDRKGVCSVQCAERSDTGEKLSVFVQPNKNFKLPENPDTPVIMIGAGTGAAPYRSFLEEREETEAEGKSWLFFGEQHFMSDFLYQTEWQQWLKEGVLTRMDVAFSRDTEEKIYVQHRLLEKSREVYEWLEEGAYLYICGDKDYMARDVHDALRAIVEKESGRSPEEAEDFLTDLRKQKKYQRDVY